MEKKYEIMMGLKNACFDKIKTAEEDLKKLREECDHPETELCTYSTRPGQNWDNTEICSICGKVIKWHYEGNDVVVWSAEGKLGEDD